MSRKDAHVVICGGLLEGDQMVNIIIIIIIATTITIIVSRKSQAMKALQSRKSPKEKAIAIMASPRLQVPTVNPLQK